MSEKRIIVDGQEVLLSKVVNISSVGVKHVYDIEVREDHNYYANGILTHNCDYHAMLRHYSNVYGEKLFKLNDSYVDYRARSLFWHPMSPDLRIMRGRTRVAACYAGSTLVATDKGLLRVDDESLVGRQTHNGKNVFNITNWWRSHFANDVIRLHLANGMWLDVTSDHKVQAEDGVFEAQAMLGRNAVVSYSPFGKSLSEKQDQQFDTEDEAVAKMIELAYHGYSSERYGTTLFVKAATRDREFCEVIRIEKLAPQFVYDITVDSEDHMFTANGVVAKNSIDEIAYFDANKDNQKVTISGHEIYDALANSLATVRTASEILLERGYDDVFPAYMMNVTSPVSKADMIHVIIERAKGSRSIFAVTRPTWEVNPNFKRNSQFIMEQYRRDPISADRNFGANPPAIANPFIANHKMIQDCEGTHKNTIKVSPVFKKAKVLGQGYMYGEVDKIKKSGKASLVAIDAGVTNNSFALAVGSTDGYNLSVDLLAEIIPVPGYPINFTKMYDDLILPIMQARNAKVLLADRWNSRMLLDTAKQDMADIDADEETFIAEQYSLKYIDMVGVRTCMEMGILKFPKSELDTKSLLVAQDADFKEFYKNKPVAHLFKQLYTIKDLTNGVGKGDGYTDDLWRATALLVHGLQSEKYQMLLSQENFDAEIAKPVALGASKLYSGGGGQIGQGGGGQTIINGAPLGVIKRR